MWTFFWICVSHHLCLWGETTVSVEQPMETAPYIWASSPWYLCYIGNRKPVSTSSGSDAFNKNVTHQMVPDDGHWHTLFIETIKNAIKPNPGWSWSDTQRVLQSFPWPRIHFLLPRELARWPNSLVASLHCHLTLTIQVKVLFKLSDLSLSIFCTAQDWPRPFSEQRY